MNHLQNDQEEADTKMLLYAMDATANGATELYIHSPGKDVLVLSSMRSPELWVKRNHSASPRRDIGSCGEVYMPALSA